MIFLTKTVFSPGSATIINAISTGFGSAFGLGFATALLFRFVFDVIGRYTTYAALFVKVNINIFFSYSSFSPIP